MLVTTGPIQIKTTTQIIKLKRIRQGVNLLLNNDKNTLNMFDPAYVLV